MATAKRKEGNNKGLLLGKNALHENTHRLTSWPPCSSIVKRGPNMSTLVELQANGEREHRHENQDIFLII